MKRRILTVVCIVCVLILSTAFSARNPWTCPDCGKTGNTGNYCGKCGHPAPDKVTPTPRITATRAVSTPTPRKTATPTQRKTATPAPKRVFELNSNIVTDKGRVTVTWTDSENRQPYTVCYTYEGGSAVQTYYRASSDVRTKSYTFEALIPGKTYKITIIDANNQSISKTYRLPTPTEFADGKLKASSIKIGIEPRYKGVSDAYEKARKISALKASEIVSNRGKYEYGVRYTIDYPQLAYSREYLTHIALIAPNGYAESEVWSTQAYGSEYINLYWYLLGPWTFDKIYEQNGTVPAGTWTLELYWDGMFVNRSTFTVQ